MTISDIVVDFIDAEAKSAVHSLKGRSHESPVVIGVDQGFVVMVLEVGDSHQPPTKHDVWAKVVVREGG